MHSVPAGTKVVLALQSPVWAKRAKVGDAVYAVTIFPVVVNNQVAIPPGTYVSGQVDALTRPRLFSNHAEFLMHFTRIIYPNGYTVDLPDTPLGASMTGSQGVPGTEGVAASPETQAASEGIRIQGAIARVYVQVSSRSDILLDTGSQIEMVLQNAVLLDAARVADSIRRFQQPQLGPVSSAVLCRPIPGTPGTPDTVIPGTPGTPGTPDIVVPGGPGMPPTVIPGTPATSGTPPTVIPGTPGTPGVACPEPPVITNPTGQDMHTESFQVPKPVTINGKQLAAGTYQVKWAGLGPVAQTQILQNRKLVADVQARVVILEKSSPDSDVGTKDNRDGRVSLKSLRFAGREYALIFD